jgi:hypothetical protein
MINFEQINQGPEFNSDFDVKKEQDLKHIEMNARLFLQICRNEGIQPREKLLEDFKKSNRSDELAVRLHSMISGMTSYNLEDHVDFDAAKDFVRNIILVKKNSEERTEDNINERTMRKDWISVGIFSYELGENNELILHVPPTDKSPMPGQIKDSLHKVAEILKQDRGIIEVVGRSILLVHPLAKRLGFNITKDSSDNSKLISHISREDFIKRWG